MESNLSAIEKSSCAGSRRRNVTRDDLAIAVGKAKPAYSRAEARALVDQYFSEIEDGLRTDRVVSLQGFGVFKLLPKAARLGRNPRSNAGAIYPIPAHEAVSFRASPILRRSIVEVGRRYGVLAPPLSRFDLRRALRPPAATISPDCDHRPCRVVERRARRHAAFAGAIFPGALRLLRPR